MSTPRTRLFRARRRRNVQIVPLPVTLSEIERFEKASYLDPDRRGDRADEAECIETFLMDSLGKR